MSEAPRYLNICAGQRGFNIRKRDARLTQNAFPGMVVASAEALYFVPDFGSMPPAPLGGLFGKLLRAPTLGDLGGEMDLSDIPVEITEHPDWPVTWDEGLVFVLPRDAAETMRTSLMLGGIEITFADVRVLVFTPVFRRKQMAAYLAATGWKISGIPDDPDLVPRADIDPHRPTSRALQRGNQARARLVLGLVFVLVSAGVLFWQMRWVKSALAGPVIVTPADLRQLAGPDNLPNPWVSFAYDRSEDTGVGVVSMSLMETILGTGRSRYLLIQIQDRWLVAEVPEGHSGKTVTGSVEVWSTPMRREALDEIQARFPAHSILPFQLDAHTPYRRECLAMVALVAIFFLAGIYLIGVSMLRKPSLTVST